jgi:exosortase/archaeosortase family protein
LIRVNRGHARLVAWLAVTSLFTLTLYSRQLILLVSGLDELLTSTLGTVFPAYPFLALLVLLTALRWRDFYNAFASERGLVTKPWIRLTGVVLVLLPAALWALLFGQGGAPTQYLGMELSASSLVLVTYGSLLATSPTLWRVMLPYTSLYVVGLVSPLFLVEALGGQLASLSSSLTAILTKAMGLPVAWQGISFSFVSVAGEHIGSVVTPACSAAYSIGIYLGLLGLMYLDMRSSISTVARFALVGVALIPLIDSARIAITIWFGFEGGSSAFWGVHDWLGYALFLAFYVGVLLAYSRVVRGRHGRARTVAALPAQIGQ